MNCIRLSIGHLGRTAATDRATRHAGRHRGGLAIVVGVPLGILINRHDWLAAPLLGIATVLLTLPSIALFGLMIPVFSSFGQGIGAVPAITAVFLYSLLPIMRNTYLALRNVDAGHQGSRHRHRHDLRQRLRIVDLPLAVPVILAGVRTAVVMNIGVMTIAAVIGAGGLGVLISRAISRATCEAVRRRRAGQLARDLRRPAAAIAATLC